MQTDDLTVFKSFSKIPRLFRPATVTEKIDGTNACVVVLENGRILAASRNTWITPERDNFGFARWVESHTPELVGLGLGRHWGEWWGEGIQRGYGLNEKRFSLFDVRRWTSETPPPACCHVVPVLEIFKVFKTNYVSDVIKRLARFGSVAAPGFHSPEGVVVYHYASGRTFKVTCENDGIPSK